jgi:hypothetical protein
VLRSGALTPVPLIFDGGFRLPRMFPIKWVESQTGWTRVGTDGRSEAHLVRLDPRTWGVCWHTTPCLVWFRSPVADTAFADLVLQQSQQV